MSRWKRAGLQNPIVAAFGSALWPGLGHIGGGLRRRGITLVASTAVLAAASIWWVGRQRRGALVSWAVQPIWLRAAIIVSIVTLVARVIVTIDAYRAASRSEPTPHHPWLHRLAVMVIVLAVALPHLLVARYASAQLDVLNTVFTAHVTVTARPTPLAATSIAPPTSTKPVSSSPASTEPPVTTTVPLTTTIPPTTTPPPRTWDGDPRLTMALLGSDGGFGRTGVRTDTIIVLSIDVETGDAATFSIPRNWQFMTFPDGTPAAAAYPSGYSHIANEIYALGNRRPELFPNADDPAGESIRQAVAQLLGIPVQYYILIDMTGVVDTIDLFGGIDITVTEFINDSLAPIERGGPSLEIRTRPGDYHFDGHTTLAYLRSRLQSSDYNRMARQRCVVGALIDQVSAFSAIAKYTSLTDIISNHSTTDIPLRRLPDLLDVAARLDTSRITTLNFVPPDYPRGAAPTALVRSQVARVLAEPSDEPHEQITGACGSA